MKPPRTLAAVGALTVLGLLPWSTTLADRSAVGDGAAKAWFFGGPAGVLPHARTCGLAVGVIVKPYCSVGSDTFFVADALCGYSREGLDETIAACIRAASGKQTTRMSLQQSDPFYGYATRGYGVPSANTRP